MTVGTLEIKLLVRQSRSLKDKRRVIRSLKDRIRNRHNVSVAEVGALQSRQQAILGVAMVGNDPQYIDAALAKIIEIVRFDRTAELLDYELEIF